MFYKEGADSHIANLIDDRSEIVSFNESVRNQFNADYAGWVSSTPDPKFENNYKFIMVIFLYKKSIASTYIIYLFDDKEIYKLYAKAAFYALKHKNE